MSTTVRILILVGVLVISIASYIICIRLAKKIYDKNTNDGHFVIITNAFYGMALIEAIVLLFSYPNRVFLSIEKIEWISIILLAIDAVMIGILIITYGALIKKKSGYLNFIIPTVLIGAIIAFGGTMFFENISKNSIEETNKKVVSEKIEPFITEQTRGIFLEYDDNNNVVSCKYYYIEDNNFEQNEITGQEIKDVVYLENNEDCYIEKTETSIDYINHEMKPSSDEYSYTETEESYVLFLNKAQVAEYN